MRKSFKKAVAVTVALLLILGNFTGLNLLALDGTEEIVSVVVKNKEPTIYEGTHGWYNTSYDYETNQTNGEFWYECTNFSTTVNYSNGECLVVENKDELWEYTSWYQTNQEATGDWGVGHHEFEINVFGVDVTLPVEILPSPIESVSVVNVSPTEFYTQTHGYMSDYWDDEKGGYVEYWRYNIPSYELMVHYADGTSEKVDWNFSEKYGANYTSFSNQNGHNAWGAGRHQFSVYFMGKIATFDVTVKERDFTNIEVVGENNTYTEGTHGYWSTHVDNDGTEHEYYYYERPDYSYNIIYNDGSVKNLTRYEFEQIFNDGAYFDSDQSYHNSWGVGEHYFTASFLEFELKLPVIIAESNVASVDAVVTGESQYIEKTNGFTDYLGNWIYNVPEYELIITYKDGRQERVDPYSDTVYNEFGGSPYINNNDQYENPWGIGQHQFTGRLGIFTFTLDVEIVESEIKGLALIPKNNTYYEYTNGYWNYYDADQKYWYYEYPEFDIEVTLKDGSTVIYTREEFEREYGYISFSDDQYYDNKWDLGEHYFSVHILGEVLELPVIIVETNIEKVEAVVKGETVIEERTNGHLYDGHYIYNCPDYEIVVTFKDSTRQTLYHAEEIYEFFGSYPSEDSDQYENPWDVGKHQFTISVGSFEFPIDVEIVEGNIKGVSIISKQPTVREYTNGSWEWGINNEKYWCYYLPEFDIVVSYKDGTERVYDQSEFNMEFGGGINYTSDQYVNPWGVGDHEFTAQLLGFAVKVPVTIVETNIENIEVRAVDGNQITQNTHGYYTTDNNGNEFWRYDFPEFEILVTYKDGSQQVLQYGSYEYWDIIDINIIENHDQYEKPWGLGTHYFNFEIGQFNCSLEIEIIESNIKSVVAFPEKNQYIVNTQGYWSYGPEGEYYEYRLPYFTVEITFKDGTTKIYERYEVDDLYGLSVSDDQYEEPWGVGVHYFTGNIMGVEFPIEVEIVENPIKEIEIVTENNVYVENTHGYWSYSYGPDGEYKYWVYNSPSFSINVTMNDGTTATYGESEFSNTFGNIYYHGTQDYNDPWGVGEHAFEVEILGEIYEIPVTIVESNIASVEAIPTGVTRFIEGSNGYYDWDYDGNRFWCYNLPSYELRVNFKDGSYTTVYPYTYEYWQLFDSSISFYSDQYEKPWGLGEHQFKLIIGKYECYINVEIIESPIKAVSVLEMDLREYSAEPTGKFKLVYNDGTSNTVIIPQDMHFNGDVYSFDYKGMTVNLQVDKQTCDVIVACCGKSDIYNLSKYLETQYLYVEQDGEIIIFGYVGDAPEDGVLNIPETINGLPVTAISYMEYSGAYYGITEIVVPDSVVALESNAFAAFYSLRTLRLGKGIGYIDSSYFTSNDVNNVYINNDLYKDIDGVVYTADGKEMVTYSRGKGSKYTVPSGVVNIDALPEWVEFTFESSEDFVEVDGVIYNSDMTVVYSCDDNKTGEYIMPDSVTSIKSYAFADSKLSKVTISKNVSDITYCAFRSCEWLEEVDVPESVVFMDIDAFGNCENISKVNIHNVANWCDITFNSPSANPLYGAYLYVNGEIANELIIPEGVTKINQYAFAYCNGVSSLTLPASLEAIYDWNDFYGLKRVNITDLAAWCKVDLDSVLFGRGVSLYLNGEMITDLVIPDGVSAIKYGTFCYLSQLESVTIPNSVKSVSRWAFGNCENLSKLYVSDVNTLCELESNGGAFKNIEELYVNGEKVVDLILPDGVTVVKDYAFCGFDFESVDIAETVTRIAYSAFMGCNELTEVKAPDTLISIGANSFAGTLWLDNQEDGFVFIGNNLYTYKGEFRGNGTLTVPEGTLSLADSALEDLFITDIKLPESLQLIGSAALYNTDITEITIPKNVSVIGADAFGRCYDLENIYVDPENKFFASIDGVLYNKDLTRLIWCPTGKTGEITVPETVTECDQNSFISVENITVTFENANTNIWNSNLGFVPGEFGPEWNGNADILIKSENGSAVEDYTKQQNLLFENINTEVTEPVYVTSASINTAPNKTVYEYGEEFDITGLTLTVAYSDGTTDLVTSGFRAIGYDMYTVGTQTVSVVYKNQTVTFEITVNEPVITPAYITSISVNTLPNKTVYEIGEELNTDGLSLKLTYSDGTESIIENGFKVGGFDSAVAGTQTLTVYYDEFTATFDITVNEPKPVVITSVSVNTAPNKTVYEIGEELNTDGLSLKLTYSDGSSLIVDKGYLISGFDSSVSGSKTVTVTYEGFNTSFKVTVNKSADEDAAKIVVSDSTGVAGKTFKVKVALRNNPGIVSATLDLTYDSSVMTLIGVEDAGILGVTSHKPELVSPYTLVWVNDTATQNFTSNGTIVTLTFKVADDAELGSYPISISYDYASHDIYNKDAQNVKFDIVNGSVTIVNSIIGDVNGDGEVDNLDRMILTRYLANWAGYDESVVDMVASDVNCDGEVDNLDRMILTRHLANWAGYEELPCSVG